MADFSRGGCPFHPPNCDCVRANALAAADKTAFESDFDEFNDELSKNKFIPFITIGANFSF